jgi:predicted enzyme related to lactoylglutathione lyase
MELVQNQLRMKTNPHFLGLRTAICGVTDMEAAKKFYSKVLGIDPYFDEPFYIGFEIAGYELGIIPEETKNDVKGDNVHIHWGVSDINESYQRLLTLGATSHYEPTDVGGGIWVATVKDPWDNVFGIIHNPHFSLT